MIPLYVTCDIDFTATSESAERLNMFDFTFQNVS